MNRFDFGEFCKALIFLLLPLGYAYVWFHALAKPMPELEFGFPDWQLQIVTIACSFIPAIWFVLNVFLDWSALLIPHFAVAVIAWINGRFALNELKTVAYEGAQTMGANLGNHHLPQPTSWSNMAAVSAAYLLVFWFAYSAKVFDR